MTVTEMIKRIDEQCMENISCDWCPLNPKSCKIYHTDNDIKKTYKLMFGKEETEMKNEFDFNELKTGWAIKFPSGSFCIGIQTDKDEITFFERFNDGELNAICTKEDIINNECRNEHEISFYPIEVYGYSENYELFDPSTRPLLWKKEEDMNKKEYNIGKLNITPNYKDGYKTKNEGSHLDDGFIYIRTKESEDEFGYDTISIHKSELDGVINALTEIRDFIKEE